MSGKEEPESFTAGLLKVVGIALIMSSILVLLLWFVDAFRDPSNDEFWDEFFATTTDMELFFNGGVLLALGCITLGVGRILQVLENRSG